jgi:hypothetical protein
MRFICHGDVQAVTPRSATGGIAYVTDNPTSGGAGRAGQVKGRRVADRHAARTPGSDLETARGDAFQLGLSLVPVQSGECL